LGEVHYFIQEESVGSRHYFHSALSVLNHFEILKWQNLVSFYIKSQEQQNKSSLYGWTIYSNIGEYAGKAMFFDKSATKKVLF
jgi:hypothetical protein